MIDRHFSSVGTPSWEVEKWVRKYSLLRGYDFLVALTVASFHSQQYGYAFPSMENLVEASRVSESSVKRAIQNMKKSEEWVVVSGRGGPEGSRHSSQPRANRYYPTAILAGVSARHEHVDVKIQYTPEEEALAKAISEAGIVSTADILILREIWAAIPAKYQKDFVTQMASGRYGNQIARVLSLASDINEAGQSITDTIHQRLKRSRSEPAVILSWLPTWGLRVERKGAIHNESNEVTDFLLHGVTKTTGTDYGQTGQEF